MNGLRTAVAALVALALLASVGAAAAAPGAASSDAGPNGDAGPPGDLPGPVPDFVGDIHDAINGFLSGSIDALGETVSGLTPGGGDDDGADAAAN